MFLCLLHAQLVKQKGGISHKPLLKNRLTCLNTKFQKRELKLWTYTCPNNAKVQQDCILISQKWKRTFERVFSDLKTATAKIRLSLRRNKIQTIKTTRYDWFSLVYRDISYKYTETLWNKFDTLQEISETHTPNDKYKIFVTAHMKAAAEFLLTKPVVICKVPWESLIVRKKRDNRKKVPLLNIKNITIANVQKLKKVPRKATNTCQKE